jgi:fumarate hydratase subunit beta
LHLSFPFTEEKIRALKVGDEVLISGIVFTGRDAVHKYLHEGGKLPPEVKLRDGILYHCGPVMMKQDDGSWKCTAAGPTTSIREEPYQWQVIRDFGIRGVIGKGGMGDKTLAACKEYGCVYLHAVGGAAQVLADCMKKVRNVYMMKEFGAPEAIWELEIEDFPAVVTIDAHGNSLHKEIFASSQAESGCSGDWRRSGFFRDFKFHSRVEYFSRGEFWISSSGGFFNSSIAFHSFLSAAFTLSADRFKLVRNSPWLRLSR